MQLFIHHNWRL